MSEFNEHIEALMARYFAGSATTLEEIELLEWRNESDANEALFLDMEFVFFAGASIRETRHFDVDKAWNKVDGQLEKPAPKSFRIGSRQTLSIAASLFLVALLGYFLVFRSGNQEGLEYTAMDANTEVVLQDSSEVSLEKGAKLVALSKNPKSREYRLEGKARFKVVHDEEHPFIIHSGKVRIEDLGTVFTVKAIPESDTVFVEVFEGRVHLAADSVDGVELVKDENAFIVRSTGELRVQRPDLNLEIGSFDFEGQSLGEVVLALNSHFTKQVELSNPLMAHCRINVKFDDEKLDQILEILALTLQLQFEENNNVILLKGDGCN